MRRRCTYLGQAIARQPTVAIYHVNRANALRASGDLSAAVAACKEALHLKRNCAEASQALGHALLDLGQPEEAVAAYRDALRHDPKLPDVHNNLGLALRQAGHLDEAVETLRRAAAISPQDAYGQSNLADKNGAPRNWADWMKPKPCIVMCCGGILTTQWRTTAWGWCFCSRADLTKDGRNMNGASRLARRASQPARRHNGKGNHWPGAHYWFVWSRGLVPISNSAVTPHR